MDEGLKGAECADSAAGLPLPALVPTANASTEIITPVHIFCLQNQIRDMGHNLGVSCQDYMLPDTLLQVLQLSDMKAMLENSIATLQRMLDRQEIRSDINRNPSKEPPNKKRRIIQKFQTPTPFRRLILTDKILDIPAECKAKCEARRKPKIDVAIEDEILGGRVNYSPRYFISWLGNFILYCARQLPGTKGRISRNFLKGQFVYYHGKAGKTSRMLGTYTDSVITMPQLIKAVQAAWPNDLTDEVIKQLKNSRSDWCDNDVSPDLHDLVEDGGGPSHPSDDCNGGSSSHGTGPARDGVQPQPNEAPPPQGSGGGGDVGGGGGEGGEHGAPPPPSKGGDAAASNTGGTSGGGGGGGGGLASPTLLAAAAAAAAAVAAAGC